MPRTWLAATRSLRSGARGAITRHALRSEDSASRLTIGAYCSLQPPVARLAVGLLHIDQHYPPARRIADDLDLARVLAVAVPAAVVLLLGELTHRSVTGTPLLQALIMASRAWTIANRQAECIARRRHADHAIGSKTK